MWNNLIKEFKVTIKKTVEYTTYLTLNHLQDAYEEAEREMDRLDISEYEEVDSEITVEETIKCCAIKIMSFCSASYKEAENLVFALNVLGI